MSPSKYHTHSKYYKCGSFHYEPVLSYGGSVAHMPGKYVHIHLWGNIDRFGEIEDITPDSVILVADEGEARGEDGVVMIADIYRIDEINRPSEKGNSFAFPASNGLRQVHCKDDMNDCW